MDVEVEESEISLLDLLLVVAENTKLLVLGPILAGSLALGFAFTMPQKFVSEAYLSVSDSGKQVEALMKSPRILDAALALTKPNLKVTDTVRLQWSGRFKFSAAPGIKTGGTVAKLEVSGQSPEEAHSFSNALINVWLASTKPQPETMIELERKLKIAQQSLDAVSLIISRQSAESSTAAFPKLQYDLAGSLASLLQLRNGYSNAIADIGMQIKGVSRDVVFSPPTLPTEPFAPKKTLIAVLAALASGFALLLFVFVRQAWRNAATDPEAAAKQNQLRRAFGLKSKQQAI